MAAPPPTDDEPACAALPPDLSLLEQASAAQERMPENKAERANEFFMVISNCLASGG